MSLVLIAALVVVVVLIVFGGVVLYFCSKRRKDQNAGTNPPYSVAMSNHLFKEEPPVCKNCILIEQGTMPFYECVCQQCGKVPPYCQETSYKSQKSPPRRARRNVAGTAGAQNSSRSHDIVDVGPPEDRDSPVGAGDNNTQ
ncbi:uncharacterized protein LOC131890137 isoform X2 [Tigriopus californicus]|uniref:uncharacterized protein LOC131890137 isoform X2 n=1 Tax=Tigriopus californicus TaxID=6832 RepID=UPI0027D9EB6C|nr:uncharacterized protein LOC131890137 isoform X2 [Tigriopus californicus]